MNSIKVVSIVSLIVFCFIYFVTNKKLRSEILEVFNYNFGKKIKIKNIIIAFIIFITIMYSFKNIIFIRERIQALIGKFQDDDSDYNKSKQIANSQNKRYKELFEKQTNIENCKSPYIPDGFLYLEGEWNTGFVIQDENENQFVWIPCTNKENQDEIPLLKKEIFSENNSIYFNCYEQDDFEEFLISCLENGGFYISRYEIGIENNIPVSKKDTKIWTNITWKKANELSRDMYSNINSRLINGYAMDTAISFIFDEIDFKNVPKTTKITGNKSYKNIYDLIDDMNEWTSEIRYSSNLYRGSILNENEIIFCVDRFESNKKNEKKENIGFRTIIYK